MKKLIIHILIILLISFNAETINAADLTLDQVNKIILSGDYYTALTNLDTLISKGKNLDKVYKNYAVVYTLVGKPDEAQKYYDLSSSIKASASNFYNQALIKYYSNDFKGAWTYNQKALKIDSKYMNSILLKYKILTITTDDNYEKDLMEIRSKNENNTNIDDLIVFYYFSRDSFSSAFAYIDKYKPARTNYYNALVYYCMNQKKDALKYCTKIPTSDVEGQILYRCLQMQYTPLAVLENKTKTNLGLNISLNEKLIYMNKDSTFNMKNKRITFVAAFDKDFYRGYYLTRTVRDNVYEDVKSSVYCENNFNTVIGNNFDVNLLKTYLSNYKRKELYDYYLCSVAELHKIYIDATSDISIIDKSFYKERNEVKMSIKK